MIKFLLVVSISSALLYATTDYLLAVDREFTAQLSAEHEAQEMRHVYTNFSLANTTLQGATKYLVHSPNTVVILSEQKTRLDFPNMVLYRANQKPVAITAVVATIDHALNLTTLNNNVGVEIPMRDKEPAVMKTDKLLFDSVKQLAYTDEFAKIVQGKSLMEGVGLEYGLEEEKIKFLNKVRGTYEK